MEKLTQARKNEILREKAFEMLIKEGLLGDTLLKVAGSKFMVNVDYEGEKIPVRIDFVVPKIDPEDTCQFAEDFAELYEQEQEEKSIISYKELLSNNKDKIYNINDEEETTDFIKELKSFRSSL